MPESQQNNIAATDSFDAIRQMLKDKFNLQQTGHIDFNLNQFEVFKHCHAIELQSSYVIKTDDNSSYLCKHIARQKVKPVLPTHTIIKPGRWLI